MPRGKRALRLAANSWILVGLLAVGLGCHGERRSGVPSRSDAAASAAPRAALLKLESAREARDLEGFAAGLDPTVLLLPPDDELLDGPELVRAWLPAGFARMCSLEPSNTALREVSGRWAYFTWWRELDRAAGDGPTIWTRVLVVLHRDPAGDWLLARLVWNHGPGPLRGGDA